MSSANANVNIRVNGVDNVTRPMRSAERSLRGVTQQVGRQSSFLMKHKRAVQAVGFQVSDFAVQIAGGQSAMLAFTQQGGQLLQFFGPFGAALAGIVTVFGSIAIAVGKSGKSISELGIGFGVLDTEMRALLSLWQPMKEFLIDGLNLVMNNLDRMIVYGGVIAAFFVGKWVKALVAARNITFSLVGAITVLKTALLRFLPTAILIAVGELVFLMISATKTMGSFAEALDVTKGILSDFLANAGKAFEAVGIKLKVIGAQVGMWFESQFYKVQNFVERGINTMIEGVNKFYAKVGGRGVQLIEPIDLTSDNLDAIAGYSARIDQLNDAFGRLDAEVRGTNADLMDRIRETLGIADDSSKFDLRDFLGGGGGAGDGAGDAISEVTTRLKSMKDTVEDLAKSISGSIGDAFRSMVDGTKTAKEAFRDMARNIIAQLFDVLVVQRLVGALANMLGGGVGSGGGFLGGMNLVPKVPSFDGGGRTGNGGRSGGLDGKGGFLAMLHPRETVVPDGQGGSGVVINQNITVGQGGGQVSQQRLRREMRQMVTEAVTDAMRRGGSFKGQMA